MTLVPREMIGIAWAALTLGAFFGVFGELLGLPDWVHDLSPFAPPPCRSATTSPDRWHLDDRDRRAAIAAAIVATRRRGLVTGG
ncbi:hypothetical protein [Agromyces bauzanensis]|uniref:Uncharacterized protein n=1 Tax=Agromyces bauzanensis TaxID=1308924 RepID=A0A917PNS3_9MICO|nr:hypothetical protein [Agromyces bauzanensis]GGJ85640.1 hypothetical protein GCM10011372_24940 [Agromyces bauzanensis]